jgi:hypothetical protein
MNSAKLAFHNIPNRLIKELPFNQIALKVLIFIQFLAYMIAQSTNKTYLAMQLRV